MKSGVSFYLAGAVVLLALAGCADRKITLQGDFDGTSLPTKADSYAAVEDDVTGSIAAPPRTLEKFAPLPSTRRAKKHVYLLLGGIVGRDGWVTSAGMFGLRSSLLALPDVGVTTYESTSFEKAADDIALLPEGDIVIVIGYSSGGAGATWLANLPSKPKIDLMIVYDPGPRWQMKVIGPNVKRALCYHRVTPTLFGLGGGALVGKNTAVETVDIFEDHMLVQIDRTLHQRTIAEVKKIQS